MNKFLVIGLLGLFFISGVVAIQWSSPTYKDGSEIIFDVQVKVIKPECQKEEWNNNFEEYRNGSILKEDMVNYVRSCKW